MLRRTEDRTGNGDNRDSSLVGEDDPEACQGSCRVPILGTEGLVARLDDLVGEPPSRGDIAGALEQLCPVMQGRRRLRILRSELAKQPGRRPGIDHAGLTQPSAPDEIRRHVVEREVPAGVDLIEHPAGCGRARGPRCRVAYLSPR